MSELKPILEEFQSKNYFEVLDASVDTPANLLMRSRRKLLSKYHPDRHTGVEKEIATKISSIINVAYEALTDEKFKEKYISSGYEIRYGAREDVPARKQKEITKRLRGRTYYAILALSGDDMFKGGTFETQTMETGETRTVIIPPNMQKGTHLVMKGLGEQYENGDNGDLIVVISRTGNGDTPQSLTDPQSIIPVVSSEDINKVSFFGSENIKEGEGLLYLKQCDLTQEGLIVRYY